MVKIVIENWGQKEIVVNDATKSLLKHFHEQNIDWMQDCGGKGRCTTCKAIVVEGMEKISKPTPAELNYRSQGLLGANERLCCQVRITGEVIIRVPEAFKLPHVKYGS